MPTDLGGLKKLQSLFLGGNLLGTKQGDDLRFLTSLNNCTDLRAVWGNYNNLKGTIPDSVTNFSTTFTLLALHENFISGAIPSRIGNLVNLEWLTLYDNMLMGRIPDSIGELSKLQLFSIAQNNISGVIPSSIGNMTSIVYFFLLGNMLEGTIPSSIGNCTRLSEVDISQNHLVGNVPEQLFGLSLLSIEAAQNNFTGPIPYRIGAIISARFYRSSGSVRQEKVTSPTEDRHLKLSYAELSQATDGFSLENKIGEGSFGVVYKGILPSSEQTVAVKVLKLQERGARKSFMAECEALRNIRHRNLIKTITCCSTLDSQGGDFKALVFEFMENGSLEKWLHAVPNETGGSETDMTLGVLQRLNIAIDVGNALEYLHHNGQTPIVHCDLKTSNVLLDSEFTAHVSDFGLAKFLMGDQASGRTENSSIGIRGTIGYVAPGTY
ncbi:hypothetical protein CRG98_017482 [Punica granatum]|uniref:Protein kinase domain-containing protein n=1 Tax=Punica granatum TaxID=22663 RepID=A0A2I0K0N3_PUNGR|nr:hypothetical protein CRG98_017482 [Punica granatum]